MSRLNATLNTVMYIIASESPPVNISTKGMPTNAQLEKEPMNTRTSRLRRSSSPFIKRKHSLDAPNVKKIAATERRKTHKKLRSVSPEGATGSTANALMMSIGCAKHRRILEIEYRLSERTRFVFFKMKPGSANANRTSMMSSTFTMMSSIGNSFFRARIIAPCLRAGNRF